MATVVRKTRTVRETFFLKKGHGRSRAAGGARTGSDGPRILDGAGMPLLEAVADRRTLRAAWDKVRANAGGAGGDRIPPWRFAIGLERRLERLRADTLAGRHRPGPPRRRRLRKPLGGGRELVIPCVADRVLQTAVASVLAPRFDRWMSEASFAYRKGRSVQQAVGRVRAARRGGLRWVVDGDVAQCFDSIPHGPLKARLREAVPDARLRRLIHAWLKTLAPEGRGIPQGAPLSPLLANLYLDTLDRRMQAMPGTCWVRYADDFVLLTGSRREARAALRAVEGALAELGLALNRRKTRLRAPGARLVFLGHLFKGDRDRPVRRPLKAVRRWLTGRVAGGPR